jgi:NTE family protein
VVVQINPIVRRELPKSARDIINRVNEISFNSSLIKELRAIALTQKMLEEAGIELGRRETYLHIIHADEEVQDLSASSKLNAEWSYLLRLFEDGREWAEEWLENYYDAIGQRSTLDLDEVFEDAPRPLPDGGAETDEDDL